VPRALAVVALLVLMATGCGRGVHPAPEVSTTPLPTSIAPAATKAEVDAVVLEVTDAVDAARGVRDALARASNDPSWERVNLVCTRYPVGQTDPSFGVRLTEGFHARSTRPDWWPDEVVAVDSAAAVTCFITGAARSIPPNTRVEETGPTTAEIASQGLNAAFEDLGDMSLPALRSQVEQRSASGT
jgi:hypothetical protein